MIISQCKIYGVNLGYGSSSSIKYYLEPSIIHWTSSAMRFFGIQIGLLQIALQNADAFAFV